MRKSPDILSRISLVEQAGLLKVLAHPTRLAILNTLMPGPKCVTDVCELCGTSQPNVSQHLAILRREGVVQYYEEGKSRCYFLAQPDKVKAILSALGHDESRSAPDCCHK